MDFDFVDEERKREDDGDDGVDEEYFDNLGSVSVKVTTRKKRY